MGDTPTVAEKGHPGFDSSIWYALVMHAGTPAPVQQALAQQVLRVTDMPDVADKLRSQGLIQERLVLAEFDRFIAADIRKLGNLARASGIQPE